VRENRIGKYVVEFLAQRRQFQAFYAGGIESKVISIIKDPMGLRKILVALFDGIFRNIHAPVLFMFDG